MSTIWKYELAIAPDQLVNMPSGARILTLHIQRGSPCLWALVDPDAPRETRRFITVGTGHEVSDGTYIGTYQVDDGRFVGHVFEVER